MGNESSKNFLDNFSDPTEGFTEQQLTNIFQHFDTEKDGTLTPSETQKFFEKVLKYNVKYSQSNFDAWFAALDADGSRTLKRSEMTKDAVRIRKEEREKKATEAKAAGRGQNFPRP